MRKIYSLIKETLCYKIIKADKEKNMLSHAYFISCQDEVMQRDYLKILASLLLCDKDDPCFNCRTCDLILKESLPDLKVYPKNKNIIVEDVNEIVADNYVRPLEKDRKVYILSNCDNMNFQAQNKLLKVLEEPSPSVCFLISATSEYALLPTVISRTKKLDLPFFTNEKLFSVLKDYYDDKEKLKKCVTQSSGNLSRCLSLMDGTDNLIDSDFVFLLLDGLNGTADVIDKSIQLTQKCTVGNKTDSGIFSQILNLLSIVMRDTLVYLQGKKELVLSVEDLGNISKISIEFSEGAILFVLEKIGKIEKKLKFNSNLQMAIDELLFAIVEGKYKWQK